MFESPDQFYHAMAEELNSLFQESWTKVEVEAKLFENSMNLKVVYTKADGSRESDVDDIMLPEYFFDLAKVARTPEKGLYKVCHFEFDNSGKFNVNFT